VEDLWYLGVELQRFKTPESDIIPDKIRRIVIRTFPPSENNVKGSMPCSPVSMVYLRKKDNYLYPEKTGYRLLLQI
jgi:hypothetical protein